MSNTLTFFKDNKEALTTICLVLTLAVSLFSLYFSVRNNKAVHYVNSVTKNRVEWIERLRNNISRFISLLDTEELTTHNNFTNADIFKTDINKKRNEIKEVGTNIKLQLNFLDEIDSEIIQEVDLLLDKYELLHIKITEIALSGDEKELFVYGDNILDRQKEISILSDKLIQKIQIYLKAEWNRVKYESMGKTYEKETQDFDIRELVIKFVDSNYKNNVWKRFCINTKAKFKRIWNTPGFLIIIIIAIVAFIVA